MFFVAGLGYGDEGKGTIVDFLTNQTGSTEIVRYNGGPQAMHNVIHNGNHHCFSQIGSCLNDGISTYLSEYMLVEPFALEIEKKLLKHKVNVHIDGNCTIVTPMQKIVGQIRELTDRHSSCGVGIGETIRDSKFISLKASDILDREFLHNKLDFIWRFKLDHAEQLFNVTCANEIQKLYEKLKKISVKELVKAYCNIDLDIVSGYDISSQTIFEGAQGVLLDVKHGFLPYTTKTDITFNNANKLTKNKSIRIGVIRTYTTRHGEGPFVSEDTLLTRTIPDVHNVTNKWQGKFRIGWLDILTTKYAINAVGDVDYIALTNLDRLKKFKVCIGYEYEGKENIDGVFKHDGNRIYKINPVNETSRLTKLLFDCKPIYTKFLSEKQYLSFIESELAPICIVSRGPKRDSKTLAYDLN